MKPTYLVQRLKHKPTSAFMAKATQVFGGQALQLSGDAWALLQQVFNIDAMGNAEYEFGKIPIVLGELLKDSAKLVTHELVLNRKEIAPNYCYSSAHQKARTKELNEARKAGVKPARAKPLRLPPLTRTLYILCRSEHLAGAISAIRMMALDKTYTKGGSYLATTLDPDPVYGNGGLIGWLELDNGFFFFTDQEAFNGTRDIFMGKQHETEASASTGDTR